MDMAAKLLPLHLCSPNPNRRSSFPYLKPSLSPSPPLNLRIRCAGRSQRTRKQRYPSEKKKLERNTKTLTEVKNKEEGFWRFSKLGVPVDKDPGKDHLDVSDALLQAVAKVLKFPVASMLPHEAFSIVRKSFDARKLLKEPKFVYTVDMDVKKILNLEPRTWDFISRLEPKIAVVEYIPHAEVSGDLISITHDCKGIHNINGLRESEHKIHSEESCKFPVSKKPRIAVVGSGPSGLFASLVLGELGADVTLIERGQAVEQRGRDIGALVVRKILQSESNFCFGEGGAGTWSDGKLVTRIGRNSDSVQAEDLEAHDGASKGKYTIGLGQECMAFCTEVEDVISMSLTVVASLLEKYGIDPKQIGRLEVGSETVIDKSKSIKTWLMQIFEDVGNTDIEGVDSSNACYGGTAALFNCINWVESSCWDGRYGLVVCTDSAVYAEGPARPTGGAAAIAMLIGPNAPLAIESTFRGSHMAHVYDFYKPNLSSEYPVVDGKLSQTCYLMALDSCYKRFCSKFEKLEGKQFSLSDADYVSFHSPYNKLVQKSFARMYFNDFLRNASSVEIDARGKLELFSSMSGDESYQSRDLEKVSQQVAKPMYDIKVQPATLLPKQIGNMYTASLYAALASIIHNKHTSLAGQRVIMFSYGSGLTSTMFSFKLRDGQHPFSISNIASVMNISEKLESRCLVSPESFVETLKLMEHRYGAKDFKTSGDASSLAPGTFYLTEVDAMYRRYYSKKARDSTSSISTSSSENRSVLLNGH